MANETENTTQATADDLVPIWAGLRRLVGSSKAIVVLAALAMACVGVYLGKITGQQALDFCQWIVLGYVGAVAVEDGAAKVRAVTVAQKGTSPEAIKSLFESLLPLITMLYGSKPPPAADGADPSVEVNDTEPPPPPTKPGA